MNDLMLTFPIEKKEFDGQMVVTLKDIDTLHQKPEGSARKRFNDNRRHFIEGTDFFRVSPGQLSEIRTVENQESGIGDVPQGVSERACSGGGLQVRVHCGDIWAMLRVGERFAHDHWFHGAGF